MVPLAEQTIPVRTKFTGKELDGGETPYCEFEFDLAITNFDAGRHYYGQLFVTYQDIVTSVQYDKVYNFDYDRSQQKFTLKANEQFTTRTTISRLRIATSGASGGIYNDIARSYPVDVGNGKRLAFSVDGAVLQNNPGVPQYQVTTYAITDIKRGSDLFYFGARYYDAELGSFTSTDPMDEFWNAYSYCGGDPVNLWDPTGNESDDVTTESTAEVQGDNFIVNHPDFQVPIGTVNGVPFAGFVVTPAQGPVEAPKSTVTNNDTKTTNNSGDALNRSNYTPDYAQTESHRNSPSNIFANFYQDAGPGLSKPTETLAPFILSSRDKKNIEMGVTAATVFFPVMLEIKAGKSIALGMDIAGGGLKELAEKTGASWWRNWARDGITRRSVSNHFGRAFHQAVKKANKVHFSLDGFPIVNGVPNVKGAIELGKRGFIDGNMTNAELEYISKTPEVLQKTIFYLKGKAIQPPF
jgi:RHS repeat-associated protein